MDGNGISYAEDHLSAIMVTGTTVSDTRDPGASFGPLVDIAAPSVGLWLPTVGGGYGWHTGPSFAAPQVAATAALIWGLAPGFTPAQVERVLYDGVDDLGPAGYDDTYGAGRLNVRWALWITVLRLYTMGVPAEGADPHGMGVDDLYGLAKTARDVDGDGIIDDRDTAWAYLMFRGDELKELSTQGP